MIWRPEPIRKGGPIPLYYQLAELIRDRIRRGDLAPGDRLPPERELADTVGISRMTARQAVAFLVREGTLVVRHGVGTFVAEPKLTYDALHLLGFTEETTRHGEIVSSRVLAQSRGPASAPAAAALRLEPGAETVTLVRLRSAGDRPLLLETGVLPAARCPGLEREDLERHSLYALLELRYGLRPRRARQTIEATLATAEEGDLLGVPTGAPMLLLEGVTSDDDDRPIERFKAIYRGDRLKLELESRREEIAGFNVGLAGVGTSQMSVVLT